MSNNDRERQRHHLTAETTAHNEREKLLTRISQQLQEIHHLQKTRERKAEDRRYEADKQRDEEDKENEAKNDWLLAAAVLDRIGAIFVTLIFVAGCVVFFVLFAIHP